MCRQIACIVYGPLIELVKLSCLSPLGPACVVVPVLLPSPGHSPPLIQPRPEIYYTVNTYSDLLILPNQQNIGQFLRQILLSHQFKSQTLCKKFHIWGIICFFKQN